MPTKTKVLKVPNTFPYEPDLDRLTSRLFKYLYYHTKGASKSYLNGGRSCEDVMTFELLLGLNYLPRAAFWSPVIRQAFQGADGARAALADEAEHARLVYMPNSCYLVPEKRRQSDSVVPDAIAISKDVFAFIECKGPSKSAQFSAEQLARQFVLVCREAAEKKPLLLVITKDSGPQRIEKSRASMTIGDAIRRAIKPVMKKTTGIDAREKDLIAQIPNVVASSTWDDIRMSLYGCLLQYEEDNKNQLDSTVRLAGDTISALCWHTP